MEQHPQEQSWWWSPAGVVTVGFLGVAGFFLLTEHTAHVFGVLPWLLIAACPLMHLFMHHGHGQGANSHSDGAHQEHRQEEKQ